MSAVNKVMRRQVTTAPEDSTIEAVWNLFLKNRICAIPITDNTHHLLGIVTKTDILKLFYPDYTAYTFETLVEDSKDIQHKEFQEIQKIGVSHIMHRHVIFTRSDTSIRRALARMIAQNVKQLPVLDADDTIVGMISRDEIFSFLYRLHVAIFTFKDRRNAYKLF